MKTIFTLVFSILVLCTNAQVGIGTTSPNSTLDVRGSFSLNYRSFTASETATSTDNTLAFTGSSAAILTLPDATTCIGREYSIKNESTTVPIPLLTIATTSSQTIDGSATWLLDELQRTITLISNGTNWGVLSTGAVKMRSKHVLVKSESDFPAAVAGVITLTPNTVYEINGTVSLTSKINLNGCNLQGMDGNNDKLVYLPGSGELFTGTKGGVIRILTLAAVTTGSQLFNLDMAPTENLIVRNAVIANCQNVGLIKGGYFCLFSLISYSGNINGITYQDISNLYIDKTGWFPTNSNTFEKFVGTFDVIGKQGGFSNSQLATSGIAFDISGITIVNGEGNLKNTSFSGTGTRVNGTFSDKWEVESSGLNTEKDDVAAGNLYLTSIVGTSFSAVNTPTKVLGTTSSVGLFRVGSTTDNQLTYIGTKTRRFQVIASLSVTTAAANKYFSFYIVKNGVVLPESRQSLKLATGVDKGSLTLSCTLQMATNDYIEVWAENNSDVSSMTVETLNLAIK